MLNKCNPGLVILHCMKMELSYEISCLDELLEFFNEKIVWVESKKKYGIIKNWIVFKQ